VSINNFATVCSFIGYVCGEGVRGTANSYHRTANSAMGWLIVPWNILIVPRNVLIVPGNKLKPPVTFADNLKSDAKITEVGETGV
jgi:hypothetical protein